MYIEYNPNPYGKRAGDCVVRAITKAENSDWDTTYWRLALQGALVGDVISSDNVWNEYLKRIGYRRYIIPNECPNCYTLRNFCEEYPQGTYLVKMPSHIATVIDGNYYDTWDSGDETPLYYFRKEEY